MWHTGEEKGLLGSEYFTDHPTVPRDSIVAQLNMDMVGRGMATDDVLGDGSTGGGPDYLQLVGSRRLSTELGDLVEKVNVDGQARLRVRLHARRQRPPGEHLLPQRPRDVRALRHPGRVLHHRRAPDYHQLTDEPQYIDYDKMARIATFVANVALAVADLDHRMVVDKPKPDPTAPCKQ